MPASSQMAQASVRLLPTMLRLGAAMQRWCDTPRFQAAARLELARAAAARSCADLRCPNVGLEGGPGAGEGRGCKRCSGCRAVWYCSAACSKADWRSAGGGHKWTCEQLAAEQQAQQAATAS
ncbi:hypothetical protein ABPG75_003127 [Micractinium tetrahymenae]